VDKPALYASFFGPLGFPASGECIKIGSVGFSHGL
jgi:hypothetical protein